MSTAKLPTNLIEAIRYFADPDMANEFVAELRWPDGPVCPSCGGKELGYIKTRRLWKCRNKECRRQFSVKVGTIFEDSPIPLDKWLASIWLIANVTDAHGAYSDLGDDHDHEVIDHAVTYVNGRVHTNTIENFWSLLKRGLHGTYISVEPFHLFRYLDEQVYRFNKRKANDYSRFVWVLGAVAGKRLTYEALTGKA